MSKQHKAVDLGPQFNVRNMAHIAEDINEKKGNENENRTISIPKGNSYYRRKSSAKDLGLKSHPKDPNNS